jgi:LppX_LprAFG lipoprotein
MVRSLFALAAVIAVPLALAGCGSSGTSAVEGMSAQQILTESSAKTEALTSYRFGVDVKATAKVTAGGAVGDLLRNPVDISGEGAAKDPGDFTLDLTANLGPGPIQANITKVGPALYASVLGQAIKLDVPASTVESLDATQLAPAISGWIKNPEIVGTEEVDGVSLVHIRGAVDETALAEDVGGLAGGLGAGDAVDPAAAGAGSDLETGVVDVWVGTEDMLIHRAAAEVVSKDPLDAAPQVKALDLNVSASLSDFNSPVEVTAPAGARTVDLDSITGLLGG